MISPPKQKTCKVCKARFKPWNTIAPTCEKYECKVIYAEKVAARAQELRAKRQRIEDMERRNAFKTRAEWAREAQHAFNEYIRLRDGNDPCISCGRHHQGQYHAGHYLTVGARPELRFEPDNAHKQCAPCNNYLSGNVVNYRISLIRKIGLERVEWLEGPHEAKKYTIEDLKGIKAHYRALTKALKAQEREAA